MTGEVLTALEAIEIIPNSAALGADGGKPCELAPETEDLKSLTEHRLVDWAAVGE